MIGQPCGQLCIPESINLIFLVAVDLLLPHQLQLGVTQVLITELLVFQDYGCTTVCMLCPPSHRPSQQPWPGWTLSSKISFQKIIGLETGNLKVNEIAPIDTKWKDVGSEYFLKLSTLTQSKDFSKVSSDSSLWNHDLFLLNGKYTFDWEGGTQHSQCNVFQGSLSSLDHMCTISSKHRFWIIYFQVGRWICMNHRTN